MKKILTFFTVAAACLVLAACGKDGDPVYTLSGVIQNMPTDAAKYTLKATIDGPAADLVYTCDVAANGSFSLQLPAVVPDAYLESYIEGEAPATLLVSSPDAKMNIVSIELYRDGSLEDEVVFASYSLKEASPGATSLHINQAVPCYSSSSFTVTGFMDEDGTNVDMDMDFTTGWNWIVESAIIASDGADSASGTTTLPGGMKWYMLDNLKSILGPLL